MITRQQTRILGLPVIYDDSRFSLEKEQIDLPGGGVSRFIFVDFLRILPLTFRSIWVTFDKFVRARQPSEHRPELILVSV